MIPDFERRLNDKMDQASLKDLMPGFDRDNEWQLLSQKLRPSDKRLPIPVWAYAAAIMLLLSAGSFIWYQSGNDATRLARHNNLPPAGEAVVPSAGDTSKPNKVPATEQEPKHVVAAAVKKHDENRSLNNAKHKNAPNDIIYNGTPCPIELRISQVMRCPDHQPKAISSSSTLEPDQSARLNYKDTNTIARNCSLTIKEIEIKSIVTGEVILLNSKSLPSTAQEVFSYITREKKGDVLAGMFNYDCDKKTRKHNLRIDNRDGNLILE